MPDNRIDIVLQARDNASAALSGYRRNVKDAEDATRKAGQAMEEATVSSRSLGSAVSNTGLAFGISTAAAWALGAAFRGYIQNVREATERQAALNLAVRAFDAGPIRAELQAVAKELETMTLRQQSWGGFFLNWWQRFKEEIGASTPATERQTAALKALGEVFPVEQAERFSKSLQAINQAQQAMAALDAARAAQLGRTQEYLAAQNALIEAIKRETDEERHQAELRSQERQRQATAAGTLGIEGPRIKVDYDAEVAAINERERARLRAARQATVIGTEQLRLRESLLPRNQAEALGNLATGDEGGVLFGPAAQGQVRQLLQEIEQKATERLLILIRNQGQILGENAVSDYGEPVFGPKAAAEGQQTLNDLTQQQLNLEAAKAELAARAIGLTQEEAARLQLISIEMRLQAQLQDTSLSKSQQALALFEAQAQQQAILRQEAERTQAIPGLDRGLRDMAEEFGAVGLRMQALARSVAAGMSNAFSDGFFDVLTGNFKALPDVAKQFTASMVRAVTDELGKLVTAPILSQLRGLLSTGMRAVLPVGLSTSLALGPTAADLMPAGTTGTVMTTSGRYLPAADVQTAYAAGGPVAVRALERGEIATTGGGQVYGPSPEFTQTAYVLPQTQPSLLARSLPVAASAAGLGFSAYAASQNTSGAGIALSGAAGALTGAALGRSLAESFPSLGVSSGYGAAGGAIAGAAITATLAALAQQKAAQEAAKARQLAEVQRAAGAGNDLLSAAQGAKNLPELFDIITQFGSGYTGGRTNPAVSVSVDTPEGRKAIGLPNSTLPTASLADLMANPESLQAGIQAGVDPNALAGPNAATSQGLQAITKNLLEQYNAQAQNVGVSQQELLPTAEGGVRRRTEVPATLASRFTGSDFNVEGAGLVGMDDATVATLYSQLVRYDRDQGFQRIVRDENDMIVSVTLAQAPVLPPTPPVQTTPPPVIPGEPGVSTGEALTMGGAAAIGIASALADPNSILNKLLPQGYTAPELAAKLMQLVSTGSLSGTAGTVALGDLEAAGRGLFESIDQIGTQATAGATFGFSQGLGVLSGLGAVYGLVQSAQTGDPLGIVQSVLGLYSALSTIAPAIFTPISTMLGSAFAALAPTTAAALTGTSVGATTGAQVAGAVLTAATPWIAAVGPIVAGAVLWALTKDDVKDLRSWAVIGQMATAMETRARTALEQASAFMDAIRGAGITDPGVLQNALAMGSTALLLYYRKEQGPAGPIGVDAFFKHTGQSPARIQQLAAKVQQDMKDITAFLITGGTDPRALASFAPREWGEFVAGQPYSTALFNAPKTIPGGEPVMEWQSTGEGGMWVETGGRTQPEDVTQNVNQGIGLAGPRSLAVDAANTEYGGAFWSMWAFLTHGANPAQPYDTRGIAEQAVFTPQITGAQPWLPGTAAPGSVSGPTAYEVPLSIEEIRMLLAIYQTYTQSQFSAGGDAGQVGEGPGAPSATGNAGSGGESG